MTVADPRLRTYPTALVTYVEPGADAMAFTPDYDPLQMLAMGVFGDAYFGDALGQERASLLPADWSLTRSGTHYTKTRGKQCKDINYFGRPASKSREWWLDGGLIVDLDPLGWFEWYCHYWLGRRVTQYDDWQISRWRGYRKRQLAMYFSTGYPGTAQALLHWGIRAGVPGDL